jgi:hypothetical protein
MMMMMMMMILLATTMMIMMMMMMMMMSTTGVLHFNTFGAQVESSFGASRPFPGDAEAGRPADPLQLRSGCEGGHGV